MADAVRHRLARLGRDVGKLVRLGRDFPAFLRSPLTLADARAMVAERLATRAERFLAMADRAIYGNPP